MIVQIYAATCVDVALQLAELGVDQIGFVAGAYGQVHAELTFDEARAISKALKGKAISSALTMSTNIAEILRMVEIVQPNIVHISSDTEDVNLEAMQQLRQALPTEIALMKAVQIDGPDSIAVALRYAKASDYLLLDTKVSGLPGVGATGVTHDWNISRQIVQQVGDHSKVILAGGLTPANVAAAIKIAQPWAVDSNTGTNLTGDPVVKDMDRVREFVKQAKLKRET
jgi:phosphoribosylanthranilate isomerase